MQATRGLTTLSPAGSSGFMSLFKGLTVADYLTGNKLYCWCWHWHLDGWGHSSPIHLAVHLPSHHSLTLSPPQFIHPLFIHLSTTHWLIYHPSIHSTMDSPNHPLTHAPTHSSAYMFIYLSLSIHPPIYPPLYLPINPFIHSSFHLSTHPSTLSSINILIIHTTVHPSKNPLANINQTCGHW